MEYFRITKYNPIFRGKDDIYRGKDNWTEYFMAQEEPCLLQDYMIVEQNYIDLLLEIFENLKLDALTFNGLMLFEEQNRSFPRILSLDSFIHYCLSDNKDKLNWINLSGLVDYYKWHKIKEMSYTRLEWEEYWFYQLKDEIILPKVFFESFMKLSLRWFAWIFYLEGKGIKIRFWHDFYLYLSVKDWIITDEIVQKNKNKWIFIENNPDFKSFFKNIRI